MKIVYIFIIIFIHNTIYAHGTLKCGTKKRTDYKPLSSSNQIDSGQMKVPIIFHVLYKSDAENVPEADLKALVDELNLDFQAANLDTINIPNEFKALKGNPNLKFYLANKLPDGKPFSGIIRQSTRIRKFSYKRREAFEESVIINPQSYLNIYICDVNDGTDAFTPTEPNPNHDGIVLDYSYAKPGNRALTHETGHWLNLYHIFEGNCAIDGDKVTDTPPQKKNWQCPSSRVIAQCQHHVMFMNFMDYTDCRVFFTAGQVERMKQYISSYKSFETSFK